MQKVMKEGYGVTYELEDAREFGFELMAILMQHFLGGMLCLPVLLGLPQFSAPVAMAMARHGGSCEAGWEIQDYITRICEKAFGGEKGNKKNPASIMVIFGIHHFMGTMMVIPMNLFFPTCYWSSLLVCLLQAAATLALGLQQLGF